MKNIILFYSFILLTACLDSDEAGSKHEWSILQSIEYENRGLNLKDEYIFIEKKNKDEENMYVVLGISSSEHSTYTWVLLNPKYKPELKILPNRKFDVDNSIFDKLMKYEVSDEVLNELKKSVKQ